MSWRADFWLLLVKFIFFPWKFRRIAFFLLFPIFFSMLLFYVSEFENFPPRRKIDFWCFSELAPRPRKLIEFFLPVKLEMKISQICGIRFLISEKSIFGENPASRRKAKKFLWIFFTFLRLAVCEKIRKITRMKIYYENHLEGCPV